MFLRRIRPSRGCFAIRGRAIREALRLQKAVDVVDRQQHGREILDQVLPETAVGLAVDERLHQPGDGFRRLPLARVDAAVDQDRALGKAVGGRGIGVTHAIGPDLPVRDRPADDLAIDLVVHREQRLVTLRTGSA